jgi:hypothetical protein
MREKWNSAFLPAGQEAYRFGLISNGVSIGVVGALLLVAAMTGEVDADLRRLMATSSCALLAISTVSLLIAKLLDKGAKRNSTHKN